MAENDRGSALSQHGSPGERLPGLDGLRAIFCIGVVLFHVSDAFDSVFSGLLGPVYAFGGYFGNYIFFIISGLLTALLYKKPLTEGRCPFRSFAGKRLLRIYPLYVLSNLAVMLLPGVRITPQRTVSTFLLLAAGCPFVPYNDPAWFLCVLMICSLFYYLTGRISLRRPALYLPLCALFAASGAVLMRHSPELPLLCRTCGEGYLNFFLGVLFAEALTSPSVSRRLLQAAGCIVLCAAAAGIACFGLEGMPGDMRWAVSACCLSLVCLAVSAGPLIRLLRLPPLQALGACSFSVYLWHVPFARWLFFLEGRLGLQIADQRPNFLLYLALLIELSILSHHVLERKRRSLP